MSDYSDLLKWCARSRDLDGGKCIHQSIIENNLDQNRYLCNLLIYMYGKCGSVDSARLVFHSVRKPNAFTWNIAIAAHAENGHLEQARGLLDQMPEKNSSSWNTMLAAYTRQGHMDKVHELFGKIPPQQRDEITWNSVIHACALAGDLDQAQELLDQMPRPSVESVTSLAVAYGRRGDLKKACVLFDRMSSRDVVSWNAMVDIYAREGHLNKAKEIFNKNIGLQLSVEDINFVVPWNSLLAAYARFGHLQEAKHLFDKMPLRDIITWNTMLQAFVDTDHKREAQDVFETMPERDVVSCNAAMVVLGRSGAQEVFAAMPQKNLVSWNTILSVHLQAKKIPAVAEELFHRMPERDLVSLNTMISGYSRAGHMDRVQELLKLYPLWDAATWTAIIAGYGSIGDVSSAKHCFDSLPERSGAAWSSIMAAYAREGHQEEALDLFCQMDLEGVPAERGSVAVAIDACSALSALPMGRIVHTVAIDAGMAWDVIVASSLVDLYGKCGESKAAMAIFQQMPQKNSVSWSAAMTAAAKSRSAAASAVVEIFGQMVAEGMLPDQVAFVTMLYACSHGGCLGEGLSVFASLCSDFGIDPLERHYTCVIDLLARSGQLGWCEEVIAAMPFDPGIAAWSSLLGGCNVQGDARKGRVQLARGGYISS